MEIKKSYELRQIDDKVVVLAYCASPLKVWQECNMVVRLVADELIEKSEQRISANDSIFVMRVGKEFVICRDIKGRLYISPPCIEFRLVHNDVLLLSDSWYLWTPWDEERDCAIEDLGTEVLEGFYEMFLYRHTYIYEGPPYILKYYENGSLVRMKCKHFLHMAENWQEAECIPPLGLFVTERTFCNIARVVDEKGKVLWLSIKEELEADCSSSHEFRGYKHIYHYLFTPERYHG